MSKTKQNEGSKTPIQIQMQNEGRSDSTNKNTACYTNLDGGNHSREFL